MVLSIIEVPGGGSKLRRHWIRQKHNGVAEPAVDQHKRKRKLEMQMQIYWTLTERDGTGRVRGSEGKQEYWEFYINENKKRSRPDAWRLA
jgi:hypothetical protein